MDILHIPPGQRLRQARESLGLSQEEVASRIGASRPSVTRWESGNARPTPHFRRELCALFQKEMDDLFPFTQDNSQNEMLHPLANLTPKNSSTPPSLLHDLLEKEVVLSEQKEDTFPRIEVVLSEQKEDTLPRSMSRTSPLHKSGLEHQEDALEFQERYLEFQKKWMDDTISTVHKLIDLFEPNCDPAIRAAVITKFVLAISLVGDQPLTLPEPQSVLTALRATKEEQELTKQIKEQQQQQENYSMKDLDIREALEQMNNPTVLGNSDLIRTHYISSHLEEPSTLIRRAQAVSEFLKEGLEQLRPAGIPKDDDNLWRLYNILYYLYFRYHLNNQQIQARLAITSARQFYREKQKALTMFYCHLRDLEADSQAGIPYERSRSQYASPQEPGISSPMEFVEAYQQPVSKSYTTASHLDEASAHPDRVPDTAFYQQYTETLAEQRKTAHEIAASLAKQRKTIHEIVDSLNETRDVGPYQDIVRQLTPIVRQTPNDTDIHVQSTSHKTSTRVVFTLQYQSSHSSLHHSLFPSEKALSTTLLNVGKIVLQAITLKTLIDTLLDE